MLVAQIPLFRPSLGERLPEPAPFRIVAGAGSMGEMREVYQPVDHLDRHGHTGLRMLTPIHGPPPAPISS